MAEQPLRGGLRPEAPSDRDSVGGEGGRDGDRDGEARLVRNHGLADEALDRRRDDEERYRGEDEDEGVSGGAAERHLASPPARRDDGRAEAQAGGRAEEDREELGDGVRNDPGGERDPRVLAREDPREAAEHDAVVEDEDDRRDAGEDSRREREEPDAGVVNEERRSEEGPRAEAHRSALEEARPLLGRRGEALDEGGIVHRRRHERPRRFRVADAEAGPEEAAREEKKRGEELEARRRAERFADDDGEPATAGATPAVEVGVGPHAEGVEVAYDLGVASPRAMGGEAGGMEPVEAGELARVSETETTCEPVGPIEKLGEASGIGVESVHPTRPPGDVGPASFGTTGVEAVPS